MFRPSIIVEMKIDVSNNTQKTTTKLTRGWRMKSLITSLSINMYVYNIKKKRPKKFTGIKKRDRKKERRRLEKCKGS